MTKSEKREDRFALDYRLGDMDHHGWEGRTVDGSDPQSGLRERLMLVLC